MPSVCEKISAVVSNYSAWGGSYLAVFLCQMALDHAVTGDFFWNSVAIHTNWTTFDPEMNRRAEAIPQTKIICRIILYFTIASLLSCTVQSLLQVRQMNSQALKDKRMRKAQSQLAELVRHLLGGKLEMSISNIEDLKLLMAEIAGGNNQCLGLLSQWYDSFNVMTKGATNYANADLNLSRQINANLELLVLEFRKLTGTWKFQNSSFYSPKMIRETSV